MNNKAVAWLGLIAGAICFLGATAAWAGPLTVGDRLPAITLADQHGNATQVGGDTELLLVAVDKSASDLVGAYLDGQPADFLQSRRAVYLADISAMPGIITRMFALPKMRERPYPILLANEADTLAFIPRQEGHVTVIRLHGGQVQAISHVATEGDLAALF